MVETGEQFLGRMEDHLQMQYLPEHSEAIKTDAVL